MTPQIAKLRQQLKFTEETLDDVGDHHGSEIRSYQGELESLQQDKHQIKKIALALQAKRVDSKANLNEAHHRVNQLECFNATLEASNQYYEKRYREGLKETVASSQADVQQKTPKSMASHHVIPAQSLQEAVLAKPETRPEVNISGRSIATKTYPDPVPKVIEACLLDIVWGSEVTEPLGVPVHSLPQLGPPGIP